MIFLFPKDKIELLRFHERSKAGYLIKNKCRQGTRLLKKLNFGCFNTNVKGWIGIDNALRHIIVAKIPYFLLTHTAKS